MCSCQTHQTAAASSAQQVSGEAVSLRVDDMTCGHCAGTIERAISSRLPGTSVTADPASKLVTVRGSADLETLCAIIAAAGYTLVAAPNR